MSKDKVIDFFNLIFKFQDEIEKIHDKTQKLQLNFDKKLLLDHKVEIKIKNKNKIVNFFLLGSYDTKKNIFTWNPYIKNTFLRILTEDFDPDNFGPFAEMAIGFFDSDSIKLDYKYRNVLPYLCNILFHPFNLLRLTETKNGTEIISYALSDLGIKTTPLYPKLFKIIKNQNSKEPNKKTSKKVIKKISKKISKKNKK